MTARLNLLSKPMNHHHRKILEEIYNFPASGVVKWPDVESLLISLGAVVREGKGSGISFIHGSAVANFHRPHPGNDLKPYQVHDAKSFLAAIGVDLENTDI